MTTKIETNPKATTASTNPEGHGCCGGTSTAEPTTKFEARAGGLRHRMSDAIPFMPQARRVLCSCSSLAIKAQAILAILLPNARLVVQGRLGVPLSPCDDGDTSSGDDGNDDGTTTSCGDDGDDSSSSGDDSVDSNLPKQVPARMSRIGDRAR